MSSASDTIGRIFGPAALAAANNIAGDLDTPVTGIAVMGQASLQGLQQAAAAEANLVLSYDPVFWSTGDDLAQIQTNALFQEKREFLRAHGMAAFTFRDRLQAAPDLVATGMARALGWMPEPGDANLFRRPPATLEALARELAAKLDDKTLRVVGDPHLPVSAIATSFGNTPQMPGIARLNMPIDVLVCGYAHEWEVVEYAQDMIAAGLKKAVILLGENASVQPAMKYCAEWVRTRVTDVPVTFIPLPEPYWNP